MGTWTEQQIGGHPADVFEPDSPGEHPAVVLFLHGVHVGRLPDKSAFSDELDRHGLRLVSPVTGGSWWSDRICSDFDPEVSAERHVLDRVVPWIAETWNAAAGQIALDLSEQFL